MPGPAALLLHCPLCGGQITVQYERWDNDAPQERTSFACPWCGEASSFKASGRFLWVTRGHESMKPDPD